MSSKIKLSEAKDLYQSFRDDKRPLLLQALIDQAVIDGKDPNLVNESKFGWVSLQALKDYISDIETNGGLCNINDTHLGFAIYYGAYPDTHQDYPNQLTTMLVPTMTNPSGDKEAIIFTKTNGVVNLEKVRDIVDINVLDEEESILNRLGQTPPPKADTDLDTLISNL